jgi:peptidoglycan/LPS O-acetylase OafA/YrhL
MVYSERPIGLIEKLMVPVGLCGYSLYLVHHPYLRWLLKTFPSLWTGHSALWVLGILPWLMLAPILVFSWLYYYFIENGSIAFGKRLWTKAHPNLL